MSHASPEPAKQGLSVGMILLIVLGGLAAFCLAGVLVVGALMYPAIQAAREAARRAVCTHNLKQIGIALATYHDTYRSFPPAYVAGQNGKPMHSWRVLILPYLGDPEAASVYEQYDFDEPWDGPNNSKLIERMPYVFACPSGRNPAGYTHYVAVVGNETMWPGANVVAVRNISDGTAGTIAVAETVRMRIAWLEPRDLTLDEALQAITPPAELGPLTAHPGGANVLLCDTSVHFLDETVSPDAIRALLTINGGEEIDEHVFGH